MVTSNIGFLLQAKVHTRLVFQDALSRSSIITSLSLFWLASEGTIALDDRLFRAGSVPAAVRLRARVHSHQFPAWRHEELSPSWILSAHPGLEVTRIKTVGGGPDFIRTRRSMPHR